MAQEPGTNCNNHPLLSLDAAIFKQDGELNRTKYIEAKKVNKQETKRKKNNYLLWFCTNNLDFFLCLKNVKGLLELYILAKSSFKIMKICFL